MRVLFATVTAVVLSCLLLAVIGLVFPFLVGKHTVTLGFLITGLEAQCVCLAVGVSIGQVCSRLVIRRQGYALLAALAIIGILLLIRGLPPVNALLRLMVKGPQGTSIIVTATGYLLVALILLIASTALTQFIATRRD